MIKMNALLNDIKHDIDPSIHLQLDEFVRLAETNRVLRVSYANETRSARLEARLASVDQLACAVDLVSVGNARFASLSTEQLREIADEICEQLTYLEEGLTVLEVDPIEPAVQIRSRDPQIATDGTRTYFEVRVGTQGIVLQRFKKNTGTTRDSVPAILTRDIFARVCVDLIAAAIQ